MSASGGPDRVAEGGDAPPVPTFLGIGPGKAGSTWTYRALRAHPEVFMSPVKETLYFTREYDRGREWYLSFFQGAEDYPASGEVCQLYLYSEEAPGRVRDYRADMQLVVTPRNPVDRAFSHYLWHVRNGEVSASFEEALEERPYLFRRGFYGRHLARWLEYFPREQLLVLPFWELKEDERAFARRIYDFVGVDPDFWPEDGVQRALGAALPRVRWLARTLKVGARLARRMGLLRLVQAVKEHPLARAVWEPYPEDERPEVDPETRARLLEEVADDVRRVTELTGIDFAGRWLEGEGDERR